MSSNKLKFDNTDTGLTSETIEDAVIELKKLNNDIRKTFYFEFDKSLFETSNTLTAAEFKTKDLNTFNTLQGIVNCEKQVKDLDFTSSEYTSKHPLIYVLVDGLVYLADVYFNRRGTFFYITFYKYVNPTSLVSGTSSSLINGPYINVTPSIDSYQLQLKLGKDYTITNITISDLGGIHNYTLPVLSTNLNSNKLVDIEQLWTPTDPAQPANKKYVDDNKYSTKTIINKITTDQTAGWTYSFGYKCDDLMVFLNGENLIGKESDTQTINDYSYTKGLTNGKCTSITFTNDFTIVTDDIIKLVLINPEENS